MDFLPPPPPVEKLKKKDQIKYEVGTKTHDKMHPRPTTKSWDTRPAPIRSQHKLRSDCVPVFPWNGMTVLSGLSSPCAVVSSLYAVFSLLYAVLSTLCAVLL